MSFADIVPQMESIDGWLRVEQAQMLWNAAATVPTGGQIVEIGSYQGKSTIVLAASAPPGVTVHAIDPHAGNDRGPGQWRGPAEEGARDHEAFIENLSRAGVADRVNHVRELSEAAHPAVTGEVDLLYVDGAHGYRAAAADIVGWGARVRPGGKMFVHDVHVSVFVTLVVARHLFFTRSWRYLGRHRSMVHYCREELTGREWLSNCARQLASLPWFARNMVVKALRAAGAESVARVLGHTPGGGIH